MDLRLTRPSDEDIERVRLAAEGQGLSYERSGVVPPGYRVDEDRCDLGAGETTFERAVDAVLRWTMFDLGWVRMPPGPPPEVGRTVAFASRQLGLWTVHACRVVERFDERSGATRRGGFAYGTLATHAVSGEEAFEVVWDRHTDRVSFGVRKFSRPNALLVWALGPVARALQARFSRDALARVAAEVSRRDLRIGSA